MADDDQGAEKPSLERPSLGFGRRRRRKAEADADDQETAAQPTRRTDGRVTSPPANFSPSEPPPPLFADEVEPERAAEDAAPEEAQAAPRTPRGPGYTFPAAVLTGAFVGLVIVGLTSASFRLCEVVKGTSSCGGPGIFLLLAIFGVAVFVGALLLRVAGLVDPGSTSFLAAGLLCVISLLFLIDEIFAWYMIIAIPVVSMATFALSHWVTSALIEPAER